MPHPRPDANPAAACDAADAELVRLLAVFAKAMFTYQPTSQRTVEAGAAFQRTLRSRAQEIGGPFRLENRSDGLYTATGKVPSEPVREWLRATLQKALIGALHFEGEVELPELHKFLARLRANTAGKMRKDAKFVALWPEIFQGIELRELRFYGGYSQLDLGFGEGSGSGQGLGGDGTGDPRAALLRLELSEHQIRRILELEKRLEPLQTTSRDGQLLSLPSEILAALPAEVLHDTSARPVFVDRLLDRFERLLEVPSGSAARSPEALSGLVELFRKLPKTFFTANLEPDAHEYVAPPPSLPHRPEDDAEELEDLSRLLPRVEALPGGAIELQPEEAELQAETLRVCLHHLGADAVPRVAAPAAAQVKKILEHPSPASRGVLERFVHHALVRSAPEPSAAVLDRALLRLERHRLLSDLRRNGGLTVERLARYFPHAFGPFLKSLEEDAPGDAEALVRVLKAIPEAALAPGVKALLQQGELQDPEMVRKMLAMGGRTALGLARQLLHAKVPLVHAKILDSLREHGSLHPEAAPVLHLDADRVPAAFVEELCEFERTCKPNPRLRSQACFLLQSFVESTPSEEPWIERKALAIAGLAVFPGPASEAVLKQQVRGEGLLGALRVPKPIRDAVHEVQARWREGRDV